MGTNKFKYVVNRNSVKTMQFSYYAENSDGFEQAITGKTFDLVLIIKDSFFVLINSDMAIVIYHIQDCCEMVYIEDINGDISDLVGTPIEIAYTASGCHPLPGGKTQNSDIFCSLLWTYYTFRTIKGTVTMRWLSQSSGYYSEKVDCLICQAGHVDDIIYTQGFERVLNECEELDEYVKTHWNIDKEEEE